MHTLLTFHLLFAWSAQAMIPTSTPFSKPEFSVTLPGHWIERASQDGYDFVSDEQGLQLFVSVLHAKAPLSKQALASATERLVQIRRGAIESLSEGKAQFEAAESPPLAGHPTRVVSGIDPENAVRFYVVICGRPNNIVTLAFTRYSLSGTAEQFRTWLATILQSVHLKGT